MRCTKNIPNAWVNDIVVRKAPRFLGLAYSPIRTERSGDSIPMDNPWSILPRSSSSKLVANIVVNHPTRTGIVTTKWANLRPNRLMMGEVMKLPTSCVIPNTAASHDSSAELNFMKESGCCSCGSRIAGKPIVQPCPMMLLPTAAVTKHCFINGVIQLLFGVIPLNMLH